MKHRYLLPLKLSFALSLISFPLGSLCFAEAESATLGGEEVKEEQADPLVKSFESEDGSYRFTVDATQAADLAEWAEAKMIPVVEEWYPQLVAMLPSDGYTAPSDVVIEFRSGIRVPAYASGNRVTLNVEWFRGELEREALGCVVHELCHVVQNYGRARRTNPNASRTPGWIVEGIPDYIRWFLFEPESRGAEITARNIGNANYNSSYRISANFLDWVVKNHDEDLVMKLSAAAREGKYSEQLWVEWTGKTVEELGAEWNEANQRRIDGNG